MRVPAVLDAVGELVLVLPLPGCPVWGDQQVERKVHAFETKHEAAVRVLEVDVPAAKLPGVLVPEQDGGVLVLLADEVEGVVESPRVGNASRRVYEVAGAVAVGVAHDADDRARLEVERDEVAAVVDDAHGRSPEPLAAAVA